MMYFFGGAVVTSLIIISWKLNRIIELLRELNP